MTTTLNNSSNNSSNSSSNSSNSNNMNTTKKNTTRRRTFQAMAAAALVVSAQAFSLPTSQLKNSRSLQQVSHADRNSLSIARASTSSLSMIMDQAEKQEFELRLGKVLDTLKKDYPTILKKSPNFAIYDPDLTVVDPSGFKLNGIRNYKQAFHLVHGIVNVFYCPEKSLLTFRMVYDAARNNIRVSWNAEVTPKMIFGGVRSMLHVDGISVYELNSAGNIREHRVEHLMINDMPVETERGIFHALRKECKENGSIPVFAKLAGGSFDYSDFDNIVRFQSPLMNSRSSLFDTSTTSLRALSTSPASASENNSGDGFDREAMDAKNKTRKKYDLKPLTVEEYMELEAQVKQMAVEETKKQEQFSIDAATATTQQQQQKEKKGGFFNNVFGQMLESNCETNFDCQRPELCCDFGVKKMCCSSGAMVGTEPQMQPLRIPVTKDDGYYNGW